MTGEADPGVKRKVRSELSFVVDVSDRLSEDLDRLLAGLTKAQRTPKLERQIGDMKDRVAVLRRCGVDGLSALEHSR